MSDDFDDEAAPVPNIPITYKAGNQTSTSRMIQQPTPGEVGHFSNKRVRTCASCRFFDKNERTDKFIRDNQIFKKMRSEYGWKEPGRYMPTTTPGALQELGICGQSQGTRMVGPTSGACDQYRLKR